MKLEGSRVEIVDWHALVPADREAVLALQISPAQTEFAGPVARSVAACEAGDPAEVAGLAIRVGGEIVGWVAFKRGASAPEWVAAGAAVVSGLRIDVRHRGAASGQWRSMQSRIGLHDIGRRPR